MVPTKFVFVIIVGLTAVALVGFAALAILVAMSLNLMARQGKG
jgi:hypothetical protein